MRRGLGWALIVAAGAAACWEPDVGAITFETGHPPIDLLEPSVGPVLGEPDEVYRVEGWYWTRYRGDWYRSRDSYAWSRVPANDLPEQIGRLPAGPYGRWREGRAHHWSRWGDVPMPSHQDDRRGANLSAPPKSRETD